MHFIAFFLVVPAFLVSILFWANPAFSASDFSKTPILFIHGHGMDKSSWDSMVSYLEARDYPGSYLKNIDLVPNTGANIPAAEQQIAPAVEDFLDQINADLQTNHPGVANKTKIDIISHSMGSLSSRWYTAKVRPDRVRKWISLAGANHGTNILCGVGVPGDGADDLCPAFAANVQESQIQYDLNGMPQVADADETSYGIGRDSAGVTTISADSSRRILYITLRTDPDSWIDPVDSVILDGTGGMDIQIPPNLSVVMTSPGNYLMTNGVDHDGMLADADTMAMVKVILDAQEESNGSDSGTGDSSGGSGGGCFIATAAYGSDAEPNVKILKDFRDRILLKSSWGRSFVLFYYEVSPPIANFISQNEALKILVRCSLIPVVFISLLILNMGTAHVSSNILCMTLFIGLTIFYIYYRQSRQRR